MTREVVQIIDKETGDVNNLRDKKLADSTTQQQSGSASTDSVVMKTTGGDYVEIARDSFVGAIKGVMDGLIKGNSYTTLGANDPIAAFNSNALGGITPANLASVLGVPRIHYKAAAINNTLSWDSGIASNNDNPKLILVLETVSTGYGMGVGRIRTILTPYSSTAAPVINTLYESSSNKNFLTISVSNNGTLVFASNGGRTDVALIW